MKCASSKSYVSTLVTKCGGILLNAHVIYVQKYSMLAVIMRRKFVVKYASLNQGRQD